MSRGLTADPDLRRAERVGKRKQGRNATNELEVIREALEAIRESGRKLSAASRTRVESLKARLAGLDYHPGIQDALALADELLALDIEPEATAAVVESVEGVRVIEAVSGTKGRQWDVVLITAGKSLNNRTYPAAVLQKAAPLFEGSFAYADHPEPAVAHRDRSIRDKVGRFSNVRFDTWTQDGKVTEGLRARFTVVAPWLRELLVEAVDAGDPEFVGFSINAKGDVNRATGMVKSIESVDSVDVVSTPAAGGRFERLVASVERSTRSMKCKHCSALFESTEAMLEHLAEAVASVPAPAPAPEPDQTLIEEVRATRAELTKATAKASLTEALAGASLTDVSKGRIRKQFTSLIESGVPFDAEALATEITEAADYEAAMAAQFSAKPVFTTTRVEAGQNVTDTKRKRLDLMLEGTGWAKDGVTPYRSLREAYHDWTGTNPFDTTGLEFFRAFAGSYDSAIDHKRVQESATTSTWAEVYADATYNQLIANYNLSPLHDQWRQVVDRRNILNVPDFRTQHFTLFGGYGDLSTVAEQATYPTATSPTDEDVTWAVAKRGLLEDLTMEAIVNDKIGIVSKIPRRMAEAASRTLYKFVMNMVTTDNPTLEIDSVALYNAAHNNTGTAALTLANLAVVRAGMQEQTAFGNTAEVLGLINAPKIIIVPAELEMLAKRIINPSGTYNMSPTADTDGSVDPQAFAGMNMQVLVYPYLTDANNWFAIADPAQMDGVVIGFFGSETPELFIQDAPTVGAVVTADKITYKVRHIYGGEVVDFRPFFNQVVT